MKKKLVTLMVAGCMVATLITGCGAQKQSDQELADNCAALIDAIYVQTRTDETDAQCAAAKAAWDALTDAQKELVEGENADPDYFGRDTGDASKDDPLNQDNIGEKEILVVSFGTSFNDSRVSDIGGVEKAIANANPDYSVRRAFTAQIIINHVQARDGEFIDNIDQALERAVNNGVKELIVQPTHLMHGAEYDELMDALNNYSDKIETISVAEPLLGQVGQDAGEINADKEAVAKAVVQAAKDAGAGDDTAIVLMGHGTSHTAKVTYSQMATQMAALGYDNVFIGTVEGEPEETAVEEVIEAVKNAGYKKVVLRPLMVVAGDHANNDMAGSEEDSWLSMFKASGNFDTIDTQIMGLGGIEAVQDIYVAHTRDAINNKGIALADSTGADASAGTYADGMYMAKFTTDSSMFHVSEAKADWGELTIKDGQMTIHVSLASKGILNLYAGLADDAKKEGAAILEPTMDQVTYADGSTEEVHGFDIPVPYIGEDFDVALVGNKGTWYDHKVRVTDVTPIDEFAVLEGNAADNAASVELSEGEHKANVTLKGGSGKATVESPAIVTASAEGNVIKLVWSSKNYDYMIVDGVKYLNEAAEGQNSEFTFPVPVLGEEFTVIGDTVAMSKAHEVEYTLLVEIIE